MFYVVNETGIGRNEVTEIACERSETRVDYYSPFSEQSKIDFSHSQRVFGTFLTESTERKI